MFVHSHFHISLIIIIPLTQSFGDRKGIALYYKENYEHVSDICKENYQISKLHSEKYDIICVYHSSDSVKAKQIDFLSNLRLTDF